MLSVQEYIRQSLALHLHFARTMKEHSFFLQTSFTAKDTNLISQADFLRKSFDALLSTAVELSPGAVSPEVLQSGEALTPYTLKAEMASSFYTGVPIQTDITQAEASLTAAATMATPLLEQRVNALNNNAIRLVNSLIQFKQAILSNVLSCNLFTVNYPLLIDHILREAKMYLSLLQKLQNREDVDLKKEAYEQESFWNQIMAEHSKFIRGLLDPTENDLIKTANDFGNEFDELTAESKRAMDNTLPLKKVTDDSLEATRKIRDFKTAGTQGILGCKIRSIILPLLADHVLREANHYLRLLNEFEKVR